MSKSPSEKTQLATARRELKRALQRLQAANASVHEYRTRATRAEQELAEWKARFDKLLERTPSESDKRFPPHPSAEQT